MAINEKRVALYIRNFEKALNGYVKTEPLARYLTRFFKENKQMGSSDRRMTSRFIYNFFRLGNALKDLSNTDRLVYAEFLCESGSDLVSLYRPELALQINQSLPAKINLLKSTVGFNVHDVFPFTEYLSDDIDTEQFVISHFTQPNLFIRIKRGHEDYVTQALEKKEVNYKTIKPYTLALPNGFRMQDFPSLIGKYEVQDLSSQHTIEFMNAQAGESWWDACAASGGKALMLLDKYPNTNLLVSDIRLSILRNLNERFEQANVKAPKRQKIMDLTTDTQSILGEETFDGIILDVPCSGSGTWGRTPEMIQHFSREKLDEFATLQKNIASNVIKHLKKGAPLVYMTCSVYAEENENMVRYLVDQFGLQIEKMELIKGYQNCADSMFAARLVKPS